MHFLSSLLFLLFFTSFSYAALVVDFDFSAASTTPSPLTGIPFYLSDNVTVIGQFTVTCNPGDTANINVTISVHIEIQISYSLTDIYVWLGAAGTFPTLPHKKWDTNAAGGITKVYNDLRGTTFDITFTLDEFIEILQGANGVIAECFRVAVVIDVKQFCGSEHQPSALCHSPPGCRYSFEALYPATNSYFQVAIQESASGAIPLGNDSQIYDGYCIKPTVYINANTPYAGQVYSSYDPVVLGSEPGDFVEFPQHFPAVNFIINNQCRYTSPYLSGYQCGWTDIQNAIWSLLYPSAIANNPSLLLPAESMDCCNWIVGDALANLNYTPPCPGGKHIMIVYPILPGGGCIHDNDTQVIIYITDIACLSNCRVRHCHTKGIYGGGHGCHSTVQPNLEESLVFDVCLEAQCLPPPPPSSSPSISSLPVVPPSPPASTSQSPTSSASSTSVPSQSSTSVPSQSSTSVPSQSSTSVPSQSSTSVPSQSRTSYPSHTSHPSQSNRPVYPPSHTPHPSFSPCPPSESHTPYPSHSPCQDNPSASPSPTMCDENNMANSPGQHHSYP